jgi:dihydroorotase
MASLLLRGGRLIDPGRGLDLVGDLLIRGGRVAAVAPRLEEPADQVLDASGLLVAPGFIDLHTHLREPGFEYKETIETGTRAAAAGGFTTVCAMPNTEPAMDSRATVEFVLERARSAGAVRVLPIGCITRGRAGRALAEMAELADTGCVAFSDDGSSVADAALLRRALEYAAGLGLPVIEHCEDRALSGGVMHEGWVSTRLGLKGIPAAAEESIVARDIALARQTGARLHIAHVSTAGSVDLVRRARAEGLAVTAEVTPHHLTLTHEAVMGPPGATLLAYDTNARMYPPLRSPEDVAACVGALAEGVIDAVATDHAPHAAYEKLVEFDAAPNGIVGLETAFGLAMRLVHAGDLSLERLIEALTIGAARALGLDRRLPGLGTLAPGAPGDVVLLDPEREWIAHPEGFASKGRNTPLAGQTLRGRVVATIAGGRPVFSLAGAGV